MPDFQSRHAGETIDDAVEIALRLQQGTAPASYQTAPVRFEDAQTARVLLTNGDDQAVGLNGFDVAAFTLAHDGEIAVFFRSEDAVYPGLFLGGTSLDGGWPYATDEYDVYQYGGSFASGDAAHAEGSANVASAMNSHAEGNGTTASGDNAHAEGEGTEASGLNSHAEGSYSKAIGDSSHAETNGEAHGHYAHAEGFGVAFGVASSAGGNGGIARMDNSHAHGGGTPNGSDTTFEALHLLMGAFAEGELESGYAGGTTGSRRYLTLKEKDAVRFEGQIIHQVGGAGGAHEPGRFSGFARRAAGGAVVVSNVTVTWDNPAQAVATLDIVGAADRVRFVVTGGATFFAEVRALHLGWAANWRD